SAQATEPSVVLKIPAEPMIAIAERHPAFIREMALMIGRRLRDAHDSVKALAVDPVEARLAASLLRLAGREGVATKEGVRLPYHLTRQSLADMSGTTVETAIRILGRWSQEGLLDADDGRLALVDPDALQERAEGEAEERGAGGPPLRQDQLRVPCRRAPDRRLHDHRAVRARRLP